MDFHTRIYLTDIPDKPENVDKKDYEDFVKELKKNQYLLFTVVNYSSYKIDDVPIKDKLKNAKEGIHVIHHIPNTKLLHNQLRLRYFDGSISFESHIHFLYKHEELSELILLNKIGRMLPFYNLGNILTVALPNYLSLDLDVHGYRIDIPLRHLKIVLLQGDNNLGVKSKIYAMRPINLLRDLFSEKYKMLPRVKLGNSNVIIDKYVPYLLTERDGDKDIPLTSYAISEYASNRFNVPQVPFEDLCSLAGYTRKELMSIVRGVKKSNYTLTLLGLGGTGMNFIHNVANLGLLTNTFQIFKSLMLIDYDTVDITNIVRFPFDITNESNWRNSIFKNNYNIHYEDKLYKVEAVPQRYNKYLAKTIQSKIQRVTDPAYLDYREPNHIIYGIANLELRNQLSSYDGLTYIQGSHADELGSVWVNPILDEDNLYRETYGSIELSTFFMNQLIMTIETLKALATKDIHSLIDTKIWEGTFDPSMKNKKLKKTYNFR